MSEMRINHLPAPTWNWLKVNEANVKLPDTMQELPVQVVSDEIVDAGCVHEEKEFAALSSGMGESFAEYVLAAEKEKTYIAVEKKLEKPVFLSFDLSGHMAAAKGIRLDLQKDSDATVIMTYNGKSEDSSISCVDTRIFVGEGAHLKLVQLFLTGDAATLYNDVAADVAEHGSMEIVHIILSGKKNYSGCLVKLLGKKANTNMDVAYITEEGTFLDCNYVAEHYGQKTVSNIHVDGVMKAHSEKVFRGTIDFKRGSSGSVGEEKEDVLLLADDVVNKTVPLILCQEEAVEGSHGATLGKLSDDILFYLGTRGLDEDMIYKMVATGRIAGAARKIRDEKTEKMIFDLIGMETEEAVLESNA